MELNNNKQLKDIKDNFCLIFKYAEKVILKIFDFEKNRLINPGEEANNLEFKQQLLKIIQNQSKLSFKNKKNYQHFSKFMKLTHEVRNFQAHNYFNKLTDKNELLQFIESFKDAAVFLNSVNINFVNDRHLNKINDIENKYKKTKLEDEKIDSISSEDNFDLILDQVLDYYISKYKKLNERIK